MAKPKISNRLYGYQKIYLNNKRRYAAGTDLRGSKDHADEAGNGFFRDDDACRVWSFVGQADYVSWLERRKISQIDWIHLFESLCKERTTPYAHQELRSWDIQHEANVMELAMVLYSTQQNTPE